MFRIESYITSIILSYVEKYVKNLRRQDAQVSLWDGEGLFQNLDLDLDVLEEELNLPFIVLSGHINQLLIRVPWTKLGSEAVKITIDTIECVLKLKTSHQEKTRKPDKRKSTDYDELPPPSYVQSLINKIIGNLSITCNNVILKFVEDDIVLSMNIKSITFDSCNENWISDIIELTPTQLILRKIIDFSDVTICLDRRNASGCIETYLEPLLYKCSMSIRLCRMYRSPHSVRPYSTQINMFCSKIAFTLTEPQLPMFLRLLTMVLEFNRTDTSEINYCTDDDKRSPSSCSSISESNLNHNDGWVDWMWSWVPSVTLDNANINDASFSSINSIIHGHTLSTGIYIETLLFIFKITSKKANDYRPLIQINCFGTMFELISHHSDWINIRFGMSKSTLESLGYCTCGAQDCYTNTYFSSGSEQQSYLLNSLFNTNLSFDPNSDLKEFSLDHHLNKYSETILLEKTPAFSMDYLSTQIYHPQQQSYDDNDEISNFVTEEKCLLRFVAGPSVMNISSGLIHRIEFIYKLILSHDSKFFTSQPENSQIDVEDKHSTLVNSNVELMVYQITIFSPVVKVFPACHVPLSSQKYRKNQKTCNKQFDPAFENPPVAVFELKVFDCRIVTPKKKSMWFLLPSNIVQNIAEEKKSQLKIRTIFRIKDILLNINLPKSTQKLLKINNVSYNTTTDCFHTYNSDSILDIDMITVSTSKENYLLMYYILYSQIMSNHRRLIYITNYIFKSSLLNDAPGTIILKITLEGAKMFHKLDCQTTCTKIIFNNCTTKIVNNILNKDNGESTILFSTPEFIHNSLPFLHIILQTPFEKDTTAIPLVFLKVGQLDMNFDPLFFDWLVYVPEMYKKKEMKKKTSSVSDLAFFSAPSRKISETSISSDTKKKTSKASIQSSVSENISFHSANYMHLKSESKEIRIVRLFDKWKSSIIFADMSKVALYFPSKTLSTLKKNAGCKHFDLHELLQMSINNGNGLLVLKISSISLKCAILKQHVEQYLNMSPVRFPNNLWSNDGVYFPWELNFCKLECYTLHNSYEIAFKKSYKHKVQLLYPFSALCTLGITTQSHDNDVQSLKSLAACIHCDSDPISLCISEQQVRLVAHLLKRLIDVSKVIYSNVQYGTLFNRSVAHEMSSIPEDEAVESKKHTIQSKFEETMKLSGWFQWTLARLSFTIRNNPEYNSSENIKLVFNLEDVISSLDFGLSYNKLKLKVSSASIQHFTKNVKEEHWKHGPYLGLMLKGYDSLNSSKNSSKTDGFLNFTLTRAFKNSFQSTKTNRDIISPHMVGDEMFKLNHQFMNEFIMEIVIEVQPIDIVLSPFIIHTFLSVVDPLISVLLDSKYMIYSSSNDQYLESKKKLSCSTLPLFYLDIAMMRVFVPISSPNSEIQDQDTIIIQIDSIKINQNPENPITRTPIRKDLYIEAEKKGLLTIPGSIIEDRQYQIMINDFSIRCGFWVDLKQVLENIQSLSTSDPDHQPNAALLWNEGIRPKSIGSTNLDDVYLSTLCNRLSFHSVFAPAIIFEPENTLVCGSWIEVNTLTEINVTISIEQFRLLNLLLTQYKDYILSHLKTSTINQENFTQNATNSINESVTIDSGIHSTEDSSKMYDNEYNSVSFTENKMSSSNLPTSVKKNSITENKIPIDIIITGNQINLNFFNVVIKNKFRVTEPLLYITFQQPHVFFSDTNNCESCQVIFFDVAVFLAPPNTSCEIDIPDPNIYSITLFETKSNRTDEIPLAFFTLKMSCPLTIGQYKVDLNLGRAISLLLNKQKLDHMKNLLETVTSILNINTLTDTKLINIGNIGVKSFDSESLNNPGKNKSIGPQYAANDFDLNKYKDITTVADEISEIIAENPIESPMVSSPQENLWYSKPSVISLTTQQIFLLLTTKHNDNIIFSIESVYSKLNSLWKMPSERLNGEITLNSMTISVGHDWPNIQTNDLVLHPWTMSVEINLSSDSWIPKYYRPSKHIKITSDFISVDMSPSHFETLKLILNEFKYLIDFNKNKKENENLNSESDEQFYQDDLRAGAFHFIESDNSELPLPYQIFFTENVNNNPPRITWRYPQPRTLTKIEVQPFPMEVDVDIELHLQLYDEIQHCFREYTNFTFPKDDSMLLRLDSLQTVSNVWRITMSNSCALNLPLQIKSLAGCLRVDSYFSPSLVPYLQFSLSTQTIKANISYSIKKKTNLPRYDCISEVPPKHKLVLFILDQVNIGFKIQEGETSTSAQAHVKIELLNYGTLTQIPIFKLFCLFTSLHTIKPIPDVQYNIQTGPIACQLGPSIINSLRAAIDLWKNDLVDITTPYLICNDTNFSITFGQANTNETVTLNCLQCYQYTWCVPSKSPQLKIAIGNSDNLSWSDEFAILPDNLLSFTINNGNGEIYSLIVSTKTISATIKVVVSSQLNILNKTHYFLDARLAKIKQCDGQKNINQHLVFEMLSVQPGNVSPSIALHAGLKVTLKLRFFSSNFDGPWSGPIPLHSVEPINGNQNSWLVKIPKKENIKQFRSVWCHLFIEHVNKIPRILILIMPMYVVHSYLPYDTLLNFELAENKFERSTVVQVKSAIDIKDVQPIDLPGTMKDIYKLTFKLDEESSESSPPVLISYYNDIDSQETITDNSFTIEELLNGKYTTMESDTKWPFVGTQFDNVKWKQNNIPDTQTTVKVQHYGNIDFANGSTRIIKIQPWALIINTSGQIITLSNSSNALCTLENYCVVAPPIIEGTFYIDININSTIHRSEPLQLSDSQSFYMPHVNGLIPLNGNSSIVINCGNSIGHLNISSSQHNNMRTVHIQSLYLASNHSSIDLSILTVCSNPLSDSLSIPENLITHSIYLPQNYDDLCKPLSLWTLVGKESKHNEELVQYAILISNGCASCPIKLSELLNEKNPLPVLFSSCDSNPLICVTLLEQDNQYFFTIYNQPYPQIVVYNFCPVSLTIATAKKSKNKVKEPVLFSSDWNWMFIVSSGKNAFLSFPYTVAIKRFPKLLIGINENSFKGWFANIELNICESRLIPVPGQMNDIKVSIKKKALTLHVVFKPAAQFEFSANEVRLRLAKNNQIKDTSSINDELLSNNKCDNDNGTTSYSQNSIPSTLNSLWPSIKCHFHTFVFTLFIDDFGYNSKAIMAITLDNIAVTLNEVNETTKEEMELTISVNNVQIDNHAFIDGHYDFPVVLVKQKKNIEDIYCDTSFVKPLSQIINNLRRLDSAVTVKLVLDKTDQLTFAVLDLEITLFTFEAFIEDRYCYFILETLKSFKSTLSTIKQNNYVPDNFVPLHYMVLAHSHEYRNPLVFRNFIIKPFKIMISLHTSTTFYVALDRSPLDFAEFSKINLMASSYQLGRSLSLHYFLNAMYGTGWALGSLEFWGSPGGLARSVGTGLYDFVSLSAQGMTEGPKEFFVGVLSGSASLVKHVTTGALSSVTKFASSWSRTFNRLTLEVEDLEEIEEIRRLRPQNLSQGIIQGLSEFGISLLGAVGGLVNHPIQYAIQEGPERRRGFVNTVAIGLVEAITKPISGAAEFVAMTGEGFLTGVGWIKTPQLRSIPHNSNLAFGTSELRYSWLILNKHLSLNEKILLICDATMDNFDREQKLLEFTIVLTDKCLFLINDFKNIPPTVQRLSITQIVTPCLRHRDPTLVTFTICTSAQNNATYARVADYVRKSQTYLNVESRSEVENEDQTHRFMVNPQIRNHLLSFIEFLKRHNQNKGYAVI
ncbi:intermembrane lipid transfer protein VPS13B-like isoform X2 [Adelges cooleyi]|uniref:intermembrane lipid transfer protein VPS13B-like isoform X2 n=1 Tax=Adelges cooleyi TaxID=133065 RepID=UPI00217F8C3D|nr:intermembrane lipid transfer protein VPS13B-like isoform X2 [Adelges cooleyi]